MSKIEDHNEQPFMPETLIGSIIASFINDRQTYNNLRLASKLTCATMKTNPIPPPWPMRFVFHSSNNNNNNHLIEDDNDENFNDRDNYGIHDMGLDDEDDYDNLDVVCIEINPFLIGCGCANGIVYVFDHTDKVPIELFGHDLQVQSVIFDTMESHPKWLISASYDSTIRLWNMQNLRNPDNIQSTMILTGHDWGVWSVVKLPRIYYHGNSNDKSSNKGENESILSLVSGGTDRRLLLWNITTTTNSDDDDDDDNNECDLSSYSWVCDSLCSSLEFVIQTIAVADSGITTILAIGGQDTSIYIFSMTTQNVILTIPPANTSESFSTKLEFIRCDNENSFKLAAMLDDKFPKISIFDLQIIVSENDRNNNNNNNSTSSDWVFATTTKTNFQLLLNGQENICLENDMENDEAEDDFEVDTSTMAVYNAKYVVIAATNELKPSNILIWNVFTGTLQSALFCQGNNNDYNSMMLSSITCLCFSPNGHTLACGTESGTIHLFETPKSILCSGKKGGL